MEKLVNENINKYLYGPTTKEIESRIRKNINKGYYPLHKLYQDYKKIRNTELRDSDLVKKIREKIENKLNKRIKEESDNSNIEEKSDIILYGSLVGLDNIVKRVVPYDVYNLYKQTNGTILLGDGEGDICYADVLNDSVNNPNIEDFDDKSVKMIVEIENNKTYIVIETHEYWYVKHEDDWLRIDKTKYNIPPFVL